MTASECTTRTTADRLVPCHLVAESFRNPTEPTPSIDSLALMTTLPPELVLACLAQLDSKDPTTIQTLVSVSLASHTLYDLSHSSNLWRPLLELHYSRRGKPISSTDDNQPSPYETFRKRSLSDKRAKHLVRKLQQPVGRIPVMQELRTSFGSDVVQVLDDGEWSWSNREPETYLSLQYWAEEARKTILRDEAITCWNEIVERDDRGEEADDDYERGVNAFGAFRGFDPELVSPPLENYTLAMNEAHKRALPSPLKQIEQRYFDLALHPELVRLTASTPDDPVQRLRWIAEQVCDYLLSINIKPATSGTFHDLGNVSTLYHSCFTSPHVLIVNRTMIASITSNSRSSTPTLPTTTTGLFP